MVSDDRSIRLRVVLGGERRVDLDVAQVGQFGARVTDFALEYIREARWLRDGVNCASDAA